MCGITARWRMKRLEFWPGYPYWNPRYDTTTFEPVGLMRWGTGSYKLRDIRVGLVVFVAVDLMVQPYFVMEVQGSARPILGKREDTRKGKGITNKL